MFQCMLQMFHLFQTYVASVSFGCCKTRSEFCIYMQVFSYVCCKCFILMFAYVFNGYTRIFKFFLIFCKCLRRMLQVFHSDVTKVDRVLHMLQYTWEAEEARAVPMCGLVAWATSGRRWRGHTGSIGGVECRHAQRKWRRPDRRPHTSTTSTTNSLSLSLST
jgi:hypothetical protein